MPDSPVAIVTGASRGIGRLLSQHLLDAGYRVIGCSRTASDLAADAYRHVRLDVADEPAVKEMFASIRKDSGRLDVLVNNAGLASMNHAVLTPLRTVAEIFTVNVFGTYLMCREAAKLMQQRRHGRIVNFTTVAVPLNLEGEAAYASSKAAVGKLTQILAREFAPWGITVNALGPAPFRTDLLRGLPEAKIQALLERQALPRLAEFADIANAVDFFVSPRSGFVTGQILYLGGV